MKLFEVILLGIGLSMDAAAVSMTNGLNETEMKLPKILLIAFFFGVFQAGMPLIGYFAGTSFTSFIVKFTPWLSLILLSIVGGKMLIEGIKNKEENLENNKLTIGILFIQAIATSIDALAVGLIFISNPINTVIINVLIIGVTTLIISIASVITGKKFGDVLQNKAKIVGGLILICIGLKIFLEYIITVS